MGLAFAAERWHLDSNVEFRAPSAVPPDPSSETSLTSLSPTQSFSLKANHHVLLQRLKVKECYVAEAQVALPSIFVA